VEMDISNGIIKTEMAIMGAAIFITNKNNQDKAIMIIILME
jgi:hypothetical protein